MSAKSLYTFPVHLGRGATIVAEPEFDGVEWYEGYSQRHAGDGSEGRLVSLCRFDQSWDSWEVHPHGDELVLCIEGRITLHQEWADGSRQVVTIGAGEYVINSPGVWHTADVDGPATALFITSGEGTAHRPR